MTSQIFSNIYFNEFDRFVRHNLKPQAYLRYGDDFIIFCPTRKKSYKFRARATQFLANNLNLHINPKNDVIVPASSGLYFLGHRISSSEAVVDPHTAKSVLSKINSNNIASYKSLLLTPENKNQLDWIILEEMLDK